MAKYKVNIKKIYPSIPKTELLKNRECIIGISMSNPVYWRSSLNEILKWSSEHFEKTHLVVGDFLNRFNENILNAGSISDSGRKSVELGDKFMKKLHSYLQGYPQKKFNVVRWVDLLQQQKNIDEIDNLFIIYNSNIKFKKAIDEKAYQFIMSQKKRGKIIQVTDGKAIELSASYLLEELAIFNKMISEGLKIIAYPGVQLSILTAIAEGDFSEMSTYLKEGIYVQLNVLKT